MVMKRNSLFRRGIKTLLNVAVGILITLVIVFVVYLNGGEDLEVWHLADLDEEFTVNSDVQDFDDYLALENRLFAQLDNLVYAKTTRAEGTNINRFQRGSLSDPQRWSPNWNRSYEMPATATGPSVLLIHGLSDSPYSLRNMAEKLHDKGAYVVGLRVPGHGTAPSGLVKVTWQDMAAAVRLAVRHLADRNPGQPVHIVGYSNGAALAVKYALATLDQPELPKVKSLVLLSPEIGITRVAALAIWQSRLGWILGLDKLSWNSVLPEYDPFKYGSFAVNAGDVSYRITNEIQRQITELTKMKLIGDMPPVLAFSSVVDATVLAPALVANLFNRLPAGGHRLVLFDINRVAGIEPLLKWSPDEMISALKQKPHASFTLSLVTNKSNRNRPVEVYHWLPGQDEKSVEKLSLLWPKNVYSLTHVSLPFPRNDPVYGDQPNHKSPGIQLGNIALRGERGVLKISASELLRLRWNPFYSYLEENTLEFMGIEAGAGRLQERGLRSED
jgi:alpha-beta hydrolase superfamily lysophospholipase